MAAIPGLALRGDQDTSANRSGSLSDSGRAGRLMGARPTARLGMFFSVCVALLALGQHLRAESGASWVRGGVSAAKFVPNVDPQETFDLQVIRRENDSLTGMAVITRKISEKEPNHRAIDIEGVERNGEFWPAVRPEVSDDLEKGWEQVAAKTPAGQLATRPVEPHTLGISAFIDLGVFRPFIGKKHYARVVLPDGEAATFFLDNLRPPANVPSTWERARLGTDEELHPSAYERLFLVPREEQETFMNMFLMRVEAEDNHVTGYFVHGGARPPTEEEVNRQYIDPISLWATLQVAQDYHKDWRPVRPSSFEKEAIKLTAPPPVTLKTCAIQLDRFRPFIGKYRFGRVVLPSGASTVIQLFDLLPPEKELIAKEHSDWLSDTAENTKKSNPRESKTTDGRAPVAFRPPPPP